MEKYLPDRVKTAITKRYFENKKLSEIGQELDVSTEYVRQLLDNGYKKLARSKKFVDRVIDYTEINEYQTVGVTRFQNTRISSTENVVLQREHMRGRFNRFM